jgi:hypothetical protein
LQLAPPGEQQTHWINAVFVKNGQGSQIVVTGAVPEDAQVEAMLDYVQNSIDKETIKVA